MATRDTDAHEPPLAPVGRLPGDENRPPTAPGACRGGAGPLCGRRGGGVGEAGGQFQSGGGEASPLVAAPGRRGVRLRPIGTVVNGEHGPRHEGWATILSWLALEPRLAPALDGIEEFSHVLVLCWLDRVSRAERQRLRVRPRDRAELPEVGVFATRTQHRPNPIAATVVALLRREGASLLVRGLDALDGTPVLDLKPWGADFGPTAEVRVPPWWRMLPPAT